MPIRVVAAVVARRGRYLVCRRPAHKRHGGLWEFPGGKLLPGESRAAAVRRELAEELGVRAQARGAALLVVRDRGSDFVIEFVRATIRGRPAALEHSELAWRRPADLLALELAPSDRRFVLARLSIPRSARRRRGTPRAHGPGGTRRRAKRA